jgi:hypothetical protein
MFQQQVPIRIVQISGNGMRPSLFGSSVAQNIGFHAAPARIWLGQTSQDWYRRAKESLAKFDNLLNRTAMIANKT